MKLVSRNVAAFAEGITRNSGADINGFTLAITRDLGWFLILAIGILGIIVFLTTLRLAGSAGRPGLNPWVAALGALGVGLSFHLIKEQVA